MSIILILYIDSGVPSIVYHEYFITNNKSCSFMKELIATICMVSIIIIRRMLATMTELSLAILYVGISAYQIISNWLKRICNIIPLQQKPIYNYWTHIVTYTHACCSGFTKLFHSPHCDCTNRQSSFSTIQINFIQNIYCCVDMLPLLYEAT